MSPPASIQVRFCLFLDVVGFSGIKDLEMEAFLNEFLGSLAGEIKDLNPLFANTWGDAVLLVFDRAEPAGLAALRMQQLLAGKDSATDGFARELKLRIGIHGGPLVEGIDPFTGRPAFLGANINRAARIEPVVEEGQIFVSQEFAALSEAEGVTSFRCLPQGLVDLPKQGGRIRVYRLVATSAALHPSMP